MAKITKSQFIDGSLWKIFEQFCSKGISMITTIILARLLLPSDYGLIALTGVFTSLSDIIIDGGFSTALIRKEIVDENDYGCAFFISSLLAVILYILLFFAAPFISAYYNEEKLALVLRVIGLTFFIQAFSSTRNAMINRNMQFRFLFICNSTASVVSGVIGIVAACSRLGVWALVIQRLSQQFIATFLLLIKIRWHIQWKYNPAIFQSMWSFSAGVIGASLLNYLGSNIYNAVIGKIYSITDLGFYEKGGQLPMYLSLYTFGAMSAVLLPTLSSYQSDLGQVKAIIRKVTRMTAYLVFPLMIGMAFISRELIIILFSQKWEQSVTLMIYSCLYYIATPFMLINVQVFFALGKSFLRIKTECIRLGLSILSIIIFGVCLKISMNELALISAIIAFASAAVTFRETFILVNYSACNIFQDILKPAIATAIMSFGLGAIQLLLRGQTISIYVSLLLKTITGVILYLVASKMFNIDSYNEIVNMIRSKIYKNHE